MKRTLKTNKIYWVALQNGTTNKVTWTKLTGKEIVEIDHNDYINDIYVLKVI